MFVKTAALALALALALPAAAQENLLQKINRVEAGTKSLKELLNQASNPAQVIGTTRVVTGSVGLIDALKDAKGKTVFVAGLTTQPGKINPDYTQRLLVCRMSQAEAAAIKVDTLVTVKATVDRKEVVGGLQGHPDDLGDRPEVNE